MRFRGVQDFTGLLDKLLIELMTVSQQIIMLSLPKATLLEDSQLKHCYQVLTTGTAILMRRA